MEGIIFYEMEQVFRVIAEELYQIHIKFFIPCNWNLCFVSYIF